MHVKLFNGTSVPPHSQTYLWAALCMRREAGKNTYSLQHLATSSGSCQSRCNIHQNPVWVGAESLATCALCKMRHTHTSALSLQCRFQLHGARERHPIVPTVVPAGSPSRASLTTCTRSPMPELVTSMGLLGRFVPA